VIPGFKPAITRLSPARPRLWRLSRTSPNYPLGNLHFRVPASVLFAPNFTPPNGPCLKASARCSFPIARPTPSCVVFCGAIRRQPSPGADAGDQAACFKPSSTSPPRPGRRKLKRQPTGLLAATSPRDRCGVSHPFPEIGPQPCCSSSAGGPAHPAVLPNLAARFRLRAGCRFSSCCCPRPGNSRRNRIALRCSGWGPFIRKLRKDCTNSGRKHILSQFPSPIPSRRS